MKAQYLSERKEIKGRIKPRIATPEDLENIAKLMDRFKPTTIATMIGRSAPFVERNLEAAREMKRTMEGR